MRNRFSCWTALALSGLLGCSAESAEGNARSAAAPTSAQAQVAAAGSSASAPAANAADRASRPATGAVIATQPSVAQPMTSTSNAAKAAAATPASGATPSAPTTPTTITPPPTQQEKFDAVGTNPFVLAARDPFSTFAADVDTASYDVFRRNMEQAAPVPVNKDSVRLEEFVNYFEYDYPAPEQSDEHPFRIHTALAQNPYGRDTTLLRVGIQARMPQPDERKQANLVFLVDTSGSMLTEDKLPLVQYLLTQSLDILNSDDKVSIVTYAGSTAVRLEPTAVLEKDKISAVIQGLSAGGSTNGAGGIQLAYQQAESAFLQDGINHVILCTDGDFNIGVSNTDELVTMIKEKRKSGVTLTALGFGIGNLNDAMMEKVSNAGNGMFSVITSRTQASRYAEDRMLRTFLHVAKDMKIQLEWNPEKVEAYRLIGYEDRAIADKDFRDDAVDAGEVGAGHRVTALYEVVPKGKQIPKVDGAPLDKQGEEEPGDRQVNADDLVLIKVRYKQPGAGETDAAREVLVRTAGGDAPAFADADQNLRYSASIAAFAEVLKQSPFAAPDKLGLMREVFADQQERDIERKEFLALFDKAVMLLDKP